MRLLVIFTIASLAGAADAPPWFPLSPGDAWTYEHEMINQAGGGTKVTRWTTQETVESLLAIPEGTIVKRNVTTVQGHADASWIANRGAFHYLFREGCIYFLNPPDWREASKQLSPDFRRALLSRNVSPDLCLPLQAGANWSAAANPEWAWSVEGRGCGQTAFCPDSVSTFDFHLVAPLASSGARAHLWFRKDLGITAQWWFHSGTYSELRIRLLKFQPAR
jgi:hypothetical protein